MNLICVLWSKTLFTFQSILPSLKIHVKQRTFFRRAAASNKYCQSIQVPALFITFSCILDVILSSVCSSNSKLFEWFSYYKKNIMISYIYLTLSWNQASYNVMNRNWWNLKTYYLAKLNELYVQEMIQPHHIIINKLLMLMIKQN